jgi:uncharacterized membrane protein
MAEKSHPIARAIRQYFIAGLLLWLPILATYVVIRFIVRLMDSSIRLIPLHYQPEQLLGFDIPGLGLILTILLLFFTGLLATNFIGSRIVNFWENVLLRIPLVRSIYSAVKQITEAILHPAGNSFRKVILMEFPRKGIWSIGFQTNESFPHAPGDENHIMVFVPTTPNPTSGFLMAVPESEVKELPISVEEGLRTIISIGVAGASQKAQESQDS